MSQISDNDVPPEVPVPLPALPAPPSPIAPPPSTDPPPVEVHASFYMTCLQMAITMTFMWLHLAAIPIVLVFLDKAPLADYVSPIPMLLCLPGFSEGISSVPSSRRFQSTSTWKVSLVITEAIVTSAVVTQAVVRGLVRVLWYVDFAVMFEYPWVVVGQIYFWLYLCPFWNPREILIYMIGYWFVLAAMTAMLLVQEQFFSGAMYSMILVLWGSDMLLQRISRRE